MKRLLTLLPGLLLALSLAGCGTSQPQASAFAGFYSSFGSAIRLAWLPRCPLV